MIFTYFEVVFWILQVFANLKDAVNGGSGL